jgi:hypothetical protein
MLPPIRRERTRYNKKPDTLAGLSLCTFAPVELDPEKVKNLLRERERDLSHHNPRDHKVDELEKFHSLQLLAVSSK